MTMHRFVITVACAGIGATATAGSVNLYSQNFDVNNPVEFTSSTQSPVIAGAVAHFGRTNVASASEYHYGNTSGSFFSGLYSLAGATTSTVTTRSIDISNMINLQFAVDLAAGNSVGTFERNRLELEYQIDGGSWMDLMSVQSLRHLPRLSGANEVPNGTSITNIFHTFSSDIASTGTALTIRATWFDRTGFGDFIGLDNILVTGENNITVVPLPPAAFGGLAMLAGLGAYRRVRR